MTGSLFYWLRFAGLAFAFLLICSNSWSESHLAAWTWTNGSAGKFNILIGLEQTADSGCVAVGEEKEQNIGTGFAVRLSSRGDTAWVKRFPDSFFLCVAATGDSGFVLAGISNPTQDSRSACLARIDKWGDTLWSRTWRLGYDTNIGDLLMTPDGGFFAVGHVRYMVNDSTDALLLRFDAHGDTLWSRTFGGRDEDSFSRIQLSKDGGMFLYGVTRSVGSGLQDFYVVRADSNGGTLWERAFGTEFEETNGDAIADGDGGLVICGYIDQSEYPAPGIVTKVDTKAIVIRVNSQGNEVWRQTYGGKRDEDWTCRNIVSAPFGYIVNVGIKGIPGLMAMNLDGDSLWVKSRIIDRVAPGFRMIRARDGGLVLCGAMPTKASADWEMFIAKVAPTDLVK